MDGGRTRQGLGGSSSGVVADNASLWSEVVPSCILELRLYQVVRVSERCPARIDGRNSDGRLQIGGQGLPSWTGRTNFFGDSAHTGANKVSESGVPCLRSARSVSPRDRTLNSLITDRSRWAMFALPDRLLKPSRYSLRSAGMGLAKHVPDVDGDSAREPRVRVSWRRSRCAVLGSHPGSEIDQLTPMRAVRRLEMCIRPRTRYRTKLRTKRCPQCGALVRTQKRCKRCHKKLIG